MQVMNPPANYQPKPDLLAGKNILVTGAGDGIGAAAIPEDASVFLNIGTSTEAVASELLRHRNLMSWHSAETIFTEKPTSHTSP